MMLIQAYNKRWIEDFNSIKNLLAEALHPLPISIEHVGSTAVPDLAAKPIIDMDIVYNEAIDFEDIKSKLEKIGYCHNGNQGIINRDVFKRKHTLFQKGVLDTITHHLYVCLADSAALGRHIVFRDYLIAHKEARDTYQKLKLDVAQEAHQDKKRYAELKEIKSKDFIDAIIEKSKK